MIHLQHVALHRVGFLPWQKVFLPRQWKKPEITGDNWQKV